MRLKWTKEADSLHTYMAESPRYRFVMVAPPKGRVQLWVQHAADEWRTNPIDQRTYFSRRTAERRAQQFNDKRRLTRRLQ